MWRTSAAARRVSAAVPVPTASLVTPLRGPGPVTTREGNALVMRSAPPAAPAAPAVLPPTQAQALLDLDFDVSVLTSRRS